MVVALLALLIFSSPGVQARRAPAPGALGEVTAAGRELAWRLDGLRVESRWLASRHPIDWRTGRITGPERFESPRTRCSQFAAAACRRLGVYLLRPPQHSPVLLANAQFTWLSSPAARRQGWELLASGLEAQARANQGWLVVASYRNPDPKRAGHIALVRPEERDVEDLLAEGPAITQAGRQNFRRSTLATGFRNHPGGLERGEIRFFAHRVPNLTCRPDGRRSNGGPWRRIQGACTP